MTGLTKNALIDITITGVDANGYGVGHIPAEGGGFAVFTQNALKGERLRARIVKIKPRYAYAKTERIIAPSPHRLSAVTPLESGGISPCPHTGCGGCQFQHCDYPEQLNIKQQIVADALSRIGGIENPPVAPVLGMDGPFHYRCKAQFPAGRDMGFGFYAPRSHRVISVTHCNIQHPSHGAVLDAVKQYARRFNVPAYDETTGKGLVRHAVLRVSRASGEVMAALVVNGEKLPREDWLIDCLTRAGVSTALININTASSNTVLGARSRVLYGGGYIYETLGGVKYRLSVNSFFQVNPAQAEKLYSLALKMAGLSGGETVIDAHAGAGGIALYAARAVKRVFAVEIMPDTVKDGVHNAEINNIDNIAFINGASENVVPALLTGGGEWGATAVDAVFLDPPRKGCERPLLEALAAARVPKLVYISCEPSTLARDVKLLCGAGYALNAVQPVDMFPMTGKVESVCLLTV